MKKVKVKLKPEAIVKRINCLESRKCSTVEEAERNQILIERLKMQYRPSKSHKKDYCIKKKFTFDIEFHVIAESRAMAKEIVEKGSRFTTYDGIRVNTPEIISAELLPAKKDK